MTQVEEGLGLLTANPADRIALRGVRIMSQVAGISSRTTVEQTFVNLEDRAIEAVYTFPLPDGAAVCGLEVVFFDKVFTGVVEEVEKAIEKYDDAIADGHGAYMVEQHRPDVFSARVGNLKPRQAVTIRLSYVMDLAVVDRTIRLSFPTTIAPRYKGSAGMDPVDAMIDGEALNPPHVLSVPYGLTLEVLVDLGRKLEGIESPSHAIRSIRSPSNQWKVELQGGETEMDREVVLELKLAREAEPFAVAATSPAGERFLAVAFVPEFEVEDAAPAGTETVFVLDCSGSMEGESIQQATTALACCLRAMSEGDRFNVCRFGSTYQMLWAEPRAYSGAALQEALNFIARGADLGGTEILQPLEEILRRSPGGKGARNIVLLTDGQVSNEPAVLALTRRKRSHNRFFTFGIGSACSQFLINGLARSTGGAAEFIGYGERIEEKVLRAFGRMSSPPVTDVEIEFDKADAEVAPREIPPVFDGDAVRVMARLGGRVPEQVTLRCNTPAGARSWTVGVGRGEDVAGVLPVLWARAMIRSIEDENATASASNAGGIDKRAIELSKRYGVLCSGTSLVAIEHRSVEDRNEGKPELRRVPVMLAAGWGGVEQGAGMGGAMACAAPPVMAACCMAPDADDTEAELLDEISPATPARLSKALPTPPAGPAGGGLVERAKRLLGLGGPRSLKRGAVVGDANVQRDALGTGAAVPGSGPVESDRQNEADRSRPVDATDELVLLLSLQGADGGFEDADWLDAWLAARVADRSKLEAAMDGWPAMKGGPARVRRTLLILTVLQKYWVGQRDLWKRAAAKARRYVAGELKLAGAEVERQLVEFAR